MEGRVGEGDKRNQESVLHPNFAIMKFSIVIFSNEWPPSH